MGPQIQWPTTTSVGAAAGDLRRAAVLDSPPRLSGARWPIERCFQEDKSELGLDHYEHRSWTAWYRHIRLGEHRRLQAAGDDTLKGTRQWWLYGFENVPPQHAPRFEDRRASCRERVCLYV